jgi:hypothetical protein
VEGWANRQVAHSLDNELSWVEAEMSVTITVEFAITATTKDILFSDSKLTNNCDPDFSAALGLIAELLVDSLHGFVCREINRLFSMWRICRIDKIDSCGPIEARSHKR